MAVKPILEDPDPALHEVCDAISTFDDSVTDLVTDLVDTLAASGAIGLSAPQIGESSPSTLSRFRPTIRHHPYDHPPVVKSLTRLS